MRHQSKFKEESNLRAINLAYMFKYIYIYTKKCIYMYFIVAVALGIHMIISATLFVCSLLICSHTLCA